MAESNDKQLEQKEIQLNTSDGLALFREHFEEQYDEFLAASKRYEEDVTLLPIIQKGKDRYHTLQQKTAEAEASLLEDGIIEPELLISMQETYDVFLYLYLEMTDEEEVSEDDSDHKPKKTISDSYPERALPSDALITKKLLANPEVKELINKHFRSPKVFESTLWRLVRDIEEPSKLDKVLRVSHGSIFKEILRGMTVAEVSQFRELSGEQIRAALIEMQQEDGVQYDYRTYVLWMNEFEEMSEVIEPDQDMLFEELLVMYELILKETQLNT